MFHRGQLLGSFIFHVARMEEILQYSSLRGRFVKPREFTDAMAYATPSLKNSIDGSKLRRVVSMSVLKLRSQICA